MTETISIMKSSRSVDGCDVDVKFVANGKLVSKDSWSFCHMYSPVRYWILLDMNEQSYSVENGKIEYAVLKYILDSKGLSNYIK